MGVRSMKIFKQISGHDALLIFAGIYLGAMGTVAAAWVWGRFL